MSGTGGNRGAGFADGPWSKSRDRQAADFLANLQALFGNSFEFVNGKVELKAKHGLQKHPDGSVGLAPVGDGLQLATGSPEHLELSEPLKEALLNARQRPLGVKNTALGTGMVGKPNGIAGLNAESQLYDPAINPRCAVYDNAVLVNSGFRFDFTDGLNSSAIVTYDAGAEKFVISFDVTGGGGGVDADFGLVTEGTSSTQDWGSVV